LCCKAAEFPKNQLKNAAAKHEELDHETGVITCRFLMYLAARREQEIGQEIEYEIEYKSNGG
jgi:hypothetical protein